MPYDFSIRVLTDDYYLALGRFVAEFSEIEAMMQAALWHFSGVKAPTAQAVFSGVRADEACNKITRIGVAENWTQERKADWKAISDRLSILRTLRNDILHHGAQWQGIDTWLVTNRRVAHTPEKITETIVSPTSLADATTDLEKLEMHVWSFIFGDQMSAATKETMVDPARKRAWRYKSSLPAGRPRTTPNKSAGQ